MPGGLAERALEVRAMIAANLADELEDQRWSYRKAAMKLGLTHTYVTARANGSVELSGSDLMMFAELLNVPVSRFFLERQTASKPRAGTPVGQLRALYLLDNVGPAGFEPTTPWVEFRQSDHKAERVHLATVTDIFDRSRVA